MSSETKGDNIIINSGNQTNVNQGNNNQINHYATEDELKKVGEIIAQIRQEIENSDIDEDTKDTLETGLALVHKELSKDKPEKSKIKTALKFVADTGKGVFTNTVFELIKPFIF